MSTKFTTNIPNLLEKKLIDLAISTQKISALKTAIAITEARLFEEICNETNLLGKPAYSNDTARNNALTLVKVNNETWNNRQDLLDSAELERAKLQAEVEALKMNFKLHLLDRELEIALATK